MRGRGAEGTSGPHCLWFQSSSTSVGAAYVPHKTCDTDVAWFGWFGTVLFQTEPKYSLLSDNDLHERIPRLMLLAQRAF